MTDVWDIVVAALLMIGALFTLVGSIGLIRLDTSMSRLHAPTKASTLGVGSLLMASMVHGFANGAPSLHEVLVTAFLFVTAPITGNFIAKVNMHRERGKPDFAPPPDPEGWATYTKP